MDFTTKAKDELESRVKQIEDFISKKGVGSAQLEKAKKVQRNVNLAIAAGAMITLAGVIIWALSSGQEDET